MAFINLHFLIDTNLVVDTSIAIGAIQRTYDQGNLPIAVQCVQHDVDLPNKVAVGDCDVQPVPSLLTFYEDNYPAVDELTIVIFVIQSLTSTLGFFACSAHPDSMPGALLQPFALEGNLQFTLAHEVGHLLGLMHAGDPDRLMFRDTSQIVGDPPILTEEEQNIMRQSALVTPEPEDTLWFLEGGAPAFRFLVPRLGLTALPILERTVRSAVDAAGKPDARVRCRAAHAAALYDEMGIDIVRQAAAGSQPIHVRCAAVRAAESAARREQRRHPPGGASLFSAVPGADQPARRLLTTLATDSRQRVRNAALRSLQRLEIR